MLAKNPTDLFERIPSSPPIIAPVTGVDKRPLWSVMIPTYNCLAYLRETLTSVLAQDPGPEQMQIAVVDDCSTDGDVFALVQELGKNRVTYFQQEKNVGSLRNFETCLNRSIGEWVHILHGDDRVVTGFYAEIEMLFREHPEAGAAFTNTSNFSSTSTGYEVVPKAPIVKEAGIIKDFLYLIAGGQKLETPSIVVKRAVYEQLGSFFAVHYGEDWEMWTRIAANFPVAYSPKSLAHYRYMNDTSITHRSIGEGQNIRDILKVIDIIQGYVPAEHRDKIKKYALRHYSIYCISLAHALYYSDSKAAFVQAKGALAMSNNSFTVYMALKFYLKNAIRYKEILKLLKKKNNGSGAI
jgi:glycosyltransferase involved in cell wall biosynthesis